MCHNTYRVAPRCDVNVFIPLGDRGGFQNALTKVVEIFRRRVVLGDTCEKR